jgi:high-affinity iron transporter
MLTQAGARWRVVVVFLGVLAVASVASAGAPDQWSRVVREAADLLDRAVRAYEAKDVVKAQDLVNEAYFGTFEDAGMEIAIHREISGRRAREIEKLFAAIRHAIGEAETAAAVKDRADHLREALEQDARELVRLGVPPANLVDGTEREAGSERAATANTSPPGRDVKDPIVREIFARLDDAREQYGRGDRERAKTTVASAYFDLFERTGLEAAIGARFPERKAQIEAGFARVRSLIVAGPPLPVVVDALDTLKARIHAAAALRAQPRGRWATFLNGLLIIVREGFEAILIITALAAYLLKSGHRDRVRTVYGASVAAVGASMLTAIAVRALLRLDPRHQETLEGATMLVATAVLFYVSYWLISKAEADRWQRYVRTRIQASLGGGNLAALWAAAFLAVYREGAETVLFYQALLAGSDASEVAAVLSGLGAGACVLAAMFLLLRTGAVRIPIRPFFTVTSALLYYLAFVFAGKGIRELQDSGLLPVSPAHGIPTWDVVGIYPTWESLALQAALACAAVVAFVSLTLAGRRRARHAVVQS